MEGRINTQIVLKYLCVTLSLNSMTELPACHVQVTSILKSLGLAVQFEMPSEDGWFRFDALIEHPKWGRVALEVDGPFHFLYSDPAEFHGKAVVRNRSDVIGTNITYMACTIPSEILPWVYHCSLENGLECCPSNHKSLEIRRARNHQL